MKNKDTYILGIETSCDETSIAIVKNGNICIANTTLSQMDIHAEYGGVIPEVASRMHTENITIVLESTLKKAEMQIQDIDAIAVTFAPGLTGSLLVGLECAKALSFIYNKPLIKVNHIAGHIYVCNMVAPLQFPLLALVVSGGHTDLIIMDDDYKFKVIGTTLDDALGESYDKVARIIKLPYPGGPNIEAFAKKGKPTYELPISMKNDPFNFSYSGLKSSIINLVNKEKAQGNEINPYDLACSFQQVAIEQVTRKVENVFKEYPLKNMIVVGGVSANNYLRQEVKKITDKYAVNLIIPPIEYCTDNATMIACAAFPLYKAGKFASLDTNVSSIDKLFE